MIALEGSWAWDVWRGDHIKALSLEQWMEIHKQGKLQGGSVPTKSPSKQNFGNLTPKKGRLEQERRVCTLDLPVNC